MIESSSNNDVESPNHNEIVGSSDTNEIDDSSNNVEIGESPDHEEIVESSGPSDHVSFAELPSIPFIADNSIAQSEVFDLSVRNSNVVDLSVQDSPIIDAPIQTADHSDYDLLSLSFDSTNSVFFDPNIDSFVNQILSSADFDGLI